MPAIIHYIVLLLFILFTSSFFQEGSFLSWRTGAKNFLVDICSDWWMGWEMGENLSMIINVKIKLTWNKEKDTLTNLRRSKMTKWWRTFTAWISLAIYRQTNIKRIDPDDDYIVCTFVHLNHRNNRSKMSIIIRSSLDHLKQLKIIEWISTQTIRSNLPGPFFCIRPILHTDYYL